MADNNNLIKQHQVSWKGIFNKYTLHKSLKSWGCFVSILTTAMVAFYVVVTMDMGQAYNFLDYISNSTIELLPGILGFCIGGYALIVGVGDMETLKKMSTPLNSKKQELSFFQMLSGVFALSLMCQCFVLFIAYVIQVCLQLQFTTPNLILGMAINVGAIVVLIFFTLLSIWMICYTILNLFTYGQVLHFLVRKENNNNNK